MIRRTQEAYLTHTQGSARKLRKAAETIKKQNVSLAQANRLLRERSTAAMESLSATVDARDSYTAGHSRRVQKLSLAIGREIGLSDAELDLLGYAALFHDIGKLGIPDSILLKPARLSLEEWGVMRRHADEGARIIERLGFLADAVPAIRHHHERWDGSGYPDGLAGEEIPLGARIIHVADALDSMLTSRIYQAPRPVEDALGELTARAPASSSARAAHARPSAILTHEVEADGGLELSGGERIELLGRDNRRLSRPPSSTAGPPLALLECWRGGEAHRTQPRTACASRSTSRRRSGSRLRACRRRPGRAGQGAGLP